MLCGPVLLSGRWACTMRVDYEADPTFADSIGVFQADAPNSANCVNSSSLGFKASFVRLYRSQGERDQVFNELVHSTTEVRDTSLAGLGGLVMAIVGGLVYRQAPLRAS